MRKLSFWRDTEHEQIRAINEAADELDILQSNTQLTHERVDALRRQVSAQRSEIVQLKAALQAVCDLLVDLDLIEAEALGYRIDAAVADTAAEVEATPPPTTPFNSPAPAPPIMASEATCSRCRRDVPARDISFTDRGPMCEACVGALAAESE